ncbi:tRNA-queuosine alpha-mannosyltransferase domain-containing protein [Marinicella gelatinilytica]|uniref:tRNA-queuosine alpha-mannosyltransferase domain-containing protein n=1 Tax=Marinicella gelatinilytica TaxID=2996017 RepID=UPI002260AD63|nr:DUF3524 domain-containing protein [Marinicella gelatinilytica]MCX7545706.1 DUF3524 domain-containing protein [Marinicella gelatinilytica]
MKPQVLLLSAYDAESHRYWYQNLSYQLSEFDWHILTLKDRFFSWRLASNALNFKHHHHQLLSQNYDLLIATSMADLATIRGYYPHLANIPNILYFHENQFAYPDNPRQQGLLTMQLRSLMAADVADTVVFNSGYNLRSFMVGAEAFVNTMPDGIPDNLLSSIERKSSVLPVPILDDCVPSKSTVAHSELGVLTVIWNHRWEHDKAPETLLALMKLCQDQAIRFHVLGRVFKKIPKAMQSIINDHADQCLTLGYVDNRQDYLKILQTGDVVLSTAYHDFQGVSLLEAVACGCLPVAPDRLVYPDLYPADNLYTSTPGSPKVEAEAILVKLQDPSLLKHVQPIFGWRDMAEDYRQWINAWL